MTVEAFAKINIGLQIVKKREDGFHDIDTILHRVGWSDSLTFTKKEHGISLRCNLPYIPCDERNLCVRAAKSVFDHTGYRGGIHIDLLKRIPVGAGLGGGSADAASVLKALVHFLDLEITESTFFEMAARLGSDIPYFLGSGSAYVKGRGEILEYFDLRLPYCILVVYPNVHVSTSWAYRNLRLNADLSIYNLKDVLLDNIDNPSAFTVLIRNDFEPLVFQKFEQISLIKEIFIQKGADFALMSGSGSAVYGFFLDERKAVECKEFFAGRFPVHLTTPSTTIYS